MDFMKQKNSSGSITTSVLNLGRKGASMGMKGASALVSVVNIPVQQMNPTPGTTNGGFTNNGNNGNPTKIIHPATPPRTNSATGFDILSGFMGRSQHNEVVEETPYGNKSLEVILEELGLFDEEQELERLSLFFQFNKSCDVSNAPTAVSTDDDQSDDTDVRVMPIERFVMDLLKRGYEPQWCDAAFRAFSTGGLMNKYEYAIAVKTLETSEKNMNNPTWLDMRRFLVFTYYDRNVQKSWSHDHFNDFLNDLSLSKQDRPEAFGIVNKVMINVPQLVANGQEKAEDNMTLIQEFATCKVHLAMKQSEYEELMLKYLKLEKQLCALKLDMANLMETVDSGTSENDL